MPELRADTLLAKGDQVTSRTQAKALIEQGQVECFEGGQWRVLNKASEKLSSDARLRVRAGARIPYASRGGLKLAGGLSACGVGCAGLTVLDVGQSTGGFTDCLLQHGAARVVGVDVGHDQLAESLRGDSRVTCLEGINARNLPVETLLAHAPAGFPLVVMDVSFISQTLILPGLARFIAPGGHLLSLVKPQFEVGPQGIGKGGIVRDDRLYVKVRAKVETCCRSMGLEVVHYVPSPVTGGDGNREFFICARH